MTQYDMRLATPEVTEFALLCEQAKTVEDVQLCIEKAGGFISDKRVCYNTWIGWGIPSKIVLDTIIEAFNKHKQTYPNARLIDLGAGTGVYSFLLNKLANIPTVAVDLVEPTHTVKREFVNVVKEEFIPTSDDVILVVWGYGCGDTLMKYVNDYGVKCVIIQGEPNGGCTYPVDIFETEKELSKWSVTIIDGLRSFVSQKYECLSVNVLH